MELSAIADLVDALSTETETGARTYQAVVSRIDNDGTVWVNLAGSNMATPTASTSSEIEPNDDVTVEWRNNKLYIVGNTSNPSAGSLRVDAVEQAANQARTAAQSAMHDAEIAHDAAEEAQNSLKSVVQGATTVEKAVSVMQTALEAVVEYDPTNDTVQEYFWHDANGAHVLGDTSGYRNDIDSTGMTIVDVSTEEPVAAFGTSARVGREGSARIILENGEIKSTGTNGVLLFSVNETPTSGEVILERRKEYRETEVTVNFAEDVSFRDVYSGAQAGDVLEINIIVHYRHLVGQTLTGETGIYSFVLIKGTGRSGQQLDPNIQYYYSYSQDGTFEMSVVAGSVEVTHIDLVELQLGANAIVNMPAFKFGTNLNTNVEYLDEPNSFSIGDGTMASANGMAMGKYNLRGSAKAFAIGNGSDDNTRSDAFTVDWNGDVDIAQGAVYKVNGIPLTASDIGGIGKNELVVQEHTLTTSLTVSSGTQLNTTYSASKSGRYKPLGIMGWKMANGSGNGGSYALPFGIFIESSSTGLATIRAGIRAVGGNVNNCTLSVYILWMKL